jgi:hypothetical protein
MQEFGETTALSREQLLVQLEQGDARDRAFAMWALALRAASADPVVNLVRGEPDPGVRRALAVVLAGHGEIDLLVAMTRHDPNVFVRASTVQILLRFVVAGQAPWSLITERLGDAPEVRAAVLSQIRPGLPVELFDVAIAALADADANVRREAVETCHRLVRAGAFDVPRMREVIERTQDDDRRYVIGVLAGLTSTDAVHDLFADASCDVKLDVLRTCPNDQCEAWLEDPELRRRYALHAVTECSPWMLSTEVLATCVLHMPVLSDDVVEALIEELSELNEVSASLRPLLVALQATSGLDRELYDELARLI